MSLVDDVRNTINQNRSGVMYNKNNDSRTLLLAVVILVAVAVMVGYSKFKAQSTWSQYQQPQSQYQQSFANSDAQKVDLLTQAVKKIWDRTKWNSDRLTLLATINNHNLVVVQQSLPKSELILLNPDWTINKMPNRIQLDPQDQAFLQQFLKK